MRIRALSRLVAGLVGIAVAIPLNGMTSAAVAVGPEDSVTMLTSDFESGAAPWVGRGSATLSVSPVAYSGGSSALVTGRTANWNGIETDVSDLFVPGASYAVSAWVRLADGETPTDVGFTVAETPEAYTSVSEPVPATADEWVQISGSYTMPSNLTGALLYIEASDETADFLVDDVEIVGPPQGGTVDPPVSLGIDNDFEADLGAWAARGDGTATAEVTDTAAHAGTRSALVGNRTDTWNGLQTEVSSVFREGVGYTASAWVRLAAAAPPTDLRLSLQRDNAGTSSYDTLATITGVTDQAWTAVTASFTMGTADTSFLYLETVSGTVDFFVDDIVVTGGAALPVETDIPPLKDVLPWPVGVAIDGRETTGQPAELVTRHFSQITAENDMKPADIQPEEGVFTFDEADALVDFAIANGQRVYGHTLVWHLQTSEWFFEHADGTPLTSAAADQVILEDRLRAHIAGIADHYRAKYGEFGSATNPIVSFDVVNEAIDENQTDGMRRSPWFDILGEQYIDLAFQYASEAFNGGDRSGPVTLFLNDYNTEIPAKRQAMTALVTRMLDRGVPLGGVGHQFHVRLSQSVGQMQAAIDSFAGLGLVQAVTEFDAQIDVPVTEEKLLEQGYLYADAFDMFQRYDLFSVTVWGPYDSRSWLPGNPLPFDSQLQAKPAYYGIVDRSQLPTRILSVTARQADIPVDASGLNASEWDLLPATRVGDDRAAFSVRWRGDRLTALVTVNDPTVDVDDAVTLFAGGAARTVPRSGSDGGVAEEVADGYRMVIELPLSALTIGSSLAFDVRIVDGSTGSALSWNDPQNAQEDGERLGVVTLAGPVPLLEVPRVGVAPSIDGEIDESWSRATPVQTGIQVQGTPGATAHVSVLWSDGMLSVLFEVADPLLDAASVNAYEQDSVEVFLDPTNAKAGTYRPPDGQYRVNFRNQQSVSGDLAVIGDDLSSATSVVDGGYIVELSLPLGADVADGSLIGLEFQVNDATAGTRTSVRSWADPTGRSYIDTGNWGVGLLDDESSEEPVVNLEPPIVGGSVVVGGELTASGGSWSVPSPTLAYQWLRDGEAIADATSSTYRLVPADAGRVVSVLVTATAEGYSAGSAESATATVARASSTSRGSLSRLLSLGGRGIDYDIRVSAPGLEPTGTVTVFDNGRAIATAALAVGDDGRQRTRLPKLTSGLHLVTCRYAGDDQVEASRCPLRVVFVF